MGDLKRVESETEGAKLERVEPETEDEKLDHKGPTSSFKVSNQSPSIFTSDAPHTSPIAETLWSRL